MGMLSKVVQGVGKGAKGIVNKALGKTGKKSDVKDKLKAALKSKKFLLLKIKLILIGGVVIIVIALISVLIDSLTGSSSNSIKVTTSKYQEQIDNGTFSGDTDQCQRALSFLNQYGSNIGFTIGQLSDIRNQQEEALKSNQTNLEAYKSHYGLMSDLNKEKLEESVNKLKDDSGNLKSNLSEQDIELYNYYKYTKDGKFLNMITPYDNATIYEHCLRTEKYNFNKVKWMAYKHDVDEVKEVDSDGFAYREDIGLLYPTAGNYDVNKFVELLSPYLLSSHIPNAFLASAAYTSNTTTQNGYSKLDEYYKNEFGKYNNIGDFAYQIIKYGQSDITMNQYNLKNATVTSNYKNYREYQCTDTFSIKKEDHEDHSACERDSQGKETKCNVRKYSTYSYEGNYVDGTENLDPNGGIEHDERWVSDSDHTIKNTNEKDINRLYGLDIVYKLSYALAFDVKVNNQYDYQKYSDSDEQELINPKIINDSPSPYKEVVSGNHYTEEQLRSMSSEELGKLCPNGGQCSQTYTYYNGTYHEMYRYYADTVSADPSSTTKRLLDQSDIISFNKNLEGDPAKTIVSDSEFKSDQSSVKYYNDNIIGSEDTALNTIYILNSNPGIYLNYISSSQAYAKYVGYDLGDYNLGKGFSSLADSFNEIADNNNGTLPFVYGATFGFDVNASAASTLSSSKGSGMSLLKEFIHAWEYVGTPPIQDGKYVVYDDGKGHPTVGYGVDLYHCGHLQEFIDAGYGTSVGSLIDIEFVDNIEDIEIQSKQAIVAANTQGLDLTEYQIHALVCKAYNYWKSNFRECYDSYWNQERDDRLYGEPDFSHPLYTNSMSLPVTSEGEVLRGLVLRRESEFRLFQTGHYYREGVIDKWWSKAASGDVLGGAELIHTQYENEQWFYYTSGGTLYWNNIEASVNNPTHATCCATFVGAALYSAGIFTEDQMNSFNYNYCPTSFDFYSNYGDIINSYDELEAGDIVFFDYQHDGKLDHVEIYAGDNTWYGAGKTESIRKASPRNDGNYWRGPFAKAVRLRLDS